MKKIFWLGLLLGACASHKQIVCDSVIMGVDGKQAICNVH